MTQEMKFSDFGLSAETMEALKNKGFETPSPIQSLTIPLLLENRRDLIGQARTGTGKTAAYGIPIIEYLRREEKHLKTPRALILAPTRELAMQIAAELESLTGDRSIRHLAVFGGQPIDIQLSVLRRGCDVVVGTPGRVQDLLDRKALSFEEIRFAVLDEADEMLDMGFIDDIESILKSTPEDKRMLMFSATMPDPIRRIAEQFMKDPEYLSTADQEVDTSSIEQYCHEVRREEKAAALERVLATADNPYAMVFCRTRADVDELTIHLQKLGFPVEALHGELAQSQRTRIITRFKAKQFRILIATDVAARGIDVTDLTHVINYSLPQSPEIYTHRIGRTGRAGKNGVAITFATPGERRKLDIIRRETDNDIEKRPLPDGAMVVKQRKQAFFNELEKLCESEMPGSCMEFAGELLQNGLPPDELVGRLLQLRFGNELETAKYGQIGRSKRDLSRTKIMVRVELGKRDGITPSRLMKTIYEKTKIWKSKMGLIRIHDDYSEIELPGDAAALFERTWNAAPSRSPRRRGSRDR